MYLKISSSKWGHFVSVTISWTLVTLVAIRRLGNLGCHFDTKPLPRPVGVAINLTPQTTSVKFYVISLFLIFNVATIFVYSIHVPGWLQKWLNLITAPGSVSNDPGSVTWLATKYLKTVSWRNHTEKLTTLWPQNISFWPKINIPSAYFTILMLNCLENTLKLKFDSYVTAVKFLT